ncbi:DUF2513 domain-containing protein [Sneathiella marina]|uniref:DUF2513 domain-containing protein n=1 Tax=Sneathiella marina TaxID=2950108 RepID=A0ABY4W2P2_9PROT|nr:DUF2513 domain-containing protein [Sneathiella marina]USG61460.1 DUF2513 domain-containing protein [Sneathiella marina]
MKRDIEVVRSILLAIENDDDINGSYAFLYTENEPIIDEIEPQVAFYHLWLCVNGGLVEPHGDYGPGHIMVKGLTWDGHEFLDAVRNETVWAKVKNEGKAKGYELTIEIARNLATKFLNASFGL